MEALKGCRGQAARLDIILGKIRPGQTDSRWKKTRKAFVSVKHDWEIRNILDQIQRYIDVLQLYQTTSHLATLPLTDTPSSGKEMPQLFLVPFPQDSQFIGRETVLSNLDSQLESHKCAALTGIGGIGKSQVAIEHCYRFHERIPEASVFWIHSSSAERFEEAVTAIAKEAQLPGWNDSKSNKLSLVQSWLERADSQPWLLVLDSLDDRSVLFEERVAVSDSGSSKTRIVDFLPRHNRGCILVTTRDNYVAQSLCDNRQSIEILPFTPQEAQDYLRSKMSVPDQDMYSEKLVKELDHIPLAISQATGYMNMNKLTLAQYMSILTRSESTTQSLLDRELPDLRRDREAEHSVSKTWRISFEYIRIHDQRAAGIFSLMAILDRQGIPEYLLQNEEEDILDFNDSIGRLKAFSLISVETNGHTFEMHRLVQIATRKWLEIEGKLKQWQATGLSIVAKSYPNPGYGNWAQCASLAPQVQVVTQYKSDHDESYLNMSKLLGNAAMYDYFQGKYDAAVKKWLELSAVNERILGSDHPSVLEVRYWLGSSKMRLGQLTESKQMLSRTLDSARRLLGHNHKVTLRCMGDLSLVFLGQERFQEALDMGKEVVCRSREVLGDEDEATRCFVGHLAIVYVRLGRYHEAAELFEKVLSVRIRPYPTSDPSMLIEVSNLATAYSHLGRYEEAAEMHHQVLQMMCKTCGPKHPATFATMNNLASTWNAMGKCREAKELMLRVVELSRTEQGPAHPETLAFMQNLACCWAGMNRLEEAEKVSREVLESQKQILGNENPKTFTSMVVLAQVWCCQKRVKEAVALLTEMIGLCRKDVESEHRYISNSLHLFSIRESQVRLSASLDLMRECLQLSEKNQGIDHPDMETLAAELRRIQARLANLVEQAKNELQREDVDEGAENQDVSRVPAQDTISIRDVNPPGELTRSRLWRLMSNVCC